VISGSRFVGFVATARPAASRAFYSETLGLRIVDETPVAFVLDAGGGPLRVSFVETLAPAPYTVAGWEVPDIAGAVSDLAARGVAFERYDGMDQDERGIWLAPGGARVAWFRDPDGNTLSITQL
jgi:catechol 2,3-dioxygenase-like lactoylglutathione lyase family enzyme